MTRRAAQRGSALVAAVAMVAIMAIVGLAVLAMVDVQTVASNRERTSDRSFGLAESVLNLQVAEFGRAWPTALPLTCDGAITGPTGGTSTATPGCITATLVAGGLTGADFTGATWRMTASAAADGRVRVRVAAHTVGPGASDRAVEALVDRRSAPAVPAGYAVIANNFSGELGLVVNQVTNISLLRTVLGDRRLIQGGRVALRCGLLNGALQPGFAPNACVTGALSIAGPNGLSGVGDILGLQATTNYGYATAATPAVMSSLRAQAAAAGTLRTSVGHGTSCLAGTPSASTIVYIDQVGAGDGTCTIALASGTTTRVAAVVVDRGRIMVQGTGAGTAPGVLQGVLWARNGQAAASGDLITLVGQVQVRGGVIADTSTGTVGLRPGANAGTAAATQADGLASQLTQKQTELGGLTQAQIDQLSALIADTEAKRAAATAAMNKSPYPQLSCPLLTSGPNHGPLVTALTNLVTSLDALIAATSAIPGTGTYLTNLQQERTDVIASRTKAVNDSVCSLLGLNQVLASLFNTLGGVLTGVTNLLLGPGGLLAYVQNLVTSLTGQITSLTGSLGTLLTDTLAGINSQGMIVHDPVVVSSLRADGGAGIVADSFHQVPAH